MATPSRSPTPPNPPTIATHNNGRIAAATIERVFDGIVVTVVAVVGQSCSGISGSNRANDDIMVVVVLVIATQVAVVVVVLLYSYCV